MVTFSRLCSDVAWAPPPGGGRSRVSIKNGAEGMDTGRWGAPCKLELFPALESALTLPSLLFFLDLKKRGLQTHW